MVSSKPYGQIAFNLFLIIVLLVLFARVIADLISGSGALAENLFLLVVVGAGLCIGIGFLIRLMRAAQGKD